MPDRNAKIRKGEGEKRRVTKKECKRLREEFEVEGFMAPKEFWKNIANKRMFEDRRAMPREEEKDLIREHKAVHEEKFLSSWLRDDAEGKAD